MTILSNVTDLASKVTKGVPRWAYKHPSLAATGVGSGLALSPGDEAQKVEGSIMREYSGVSGSKYAGSSFDKFAAHKDACLSITSGNKGLHKEAATPDFGSNLEQGLSGGVGKGLASEALGAIRRLLGFSAQKAVDKLQKEPQRRQIVQNLMQEDPYVSEFEQQNPGQTERAFQTMRQVAPSLSLDPNIVKSYLRNTAMTGGALDFTTVKSLADAETAVHRAKNEGAWGRGGR